MESPELVARSRMRVCVPGSTSNLGPGFDFLGLALSLHLEVSASPLAPGATSGSRRHESHADGCPWPESKEDLLQIAFDRARGDGVPYRFTVRSEIPIGHGLGSSGAAVAAGLLLGNRLSNTPLTPDELLAIGIELEGHPDNVAASLFGGCTLCHPSAGDNGSPLLIQQTVHPSVGCAVAWPAEPLSTEKARGYLPATVPHSDAAENPRRLALLLRGLEDGNPELIRAGGLDRLHVRYRVEHIKGAGPAIEAAMAAGAWMASLSGAGSGVVALGPREQTATIASAMSAALGASAGGGGGCPVDLVAGAPVVA